MSATTTCAPSRASAATVAAPMPEAAPVTIATLPLTLPIVLLKLGAGGVRRHRRLLTQITYQPDSVNAVPVRGRCTGFAAPRALRGGPLDLEGTPGCAKP